MLRKLVLLPAVAVVATVCACSLQKKPATESTATAEAVTQTGSDALASDSTITELPLPEVPPTLRSPEERAAFVVAHFWDAMNFADTARSHNKTFVEQNFVNYISLFPHASAEALDTSVGKLLTKAAADTAALHIITNLAEHYLDEPNSPMRNEEFYIVFLRNMLTLPQLTADERIRPRARLHRALKNRPGTRATNFTYTARDGRRSTLHATKASALLLVFYDPACSHCEDVLRTLRDSELLTTLTANGSITVLAVYTEGDRKLWNDTKAKMPAAWHVAIDESHIFERELYDLPAMPVIYLLDAAKTVLLKDATPQQLEEYLTEAATSANI